MNDVALLAFAIAVIICTASVAAFAGHLLRNDRQDRLLFWFGLFAGIYGVRMFFKTPLVAALGIDPRLGAWVEHGFNYFILIPALLFVEQLYGQGWHRLLRRLTEATAVFAVAAIAVDIAARTPDRVPDPSNAWFVLLALVFIAGARAGYRPPRFREWKLMLTAMLVFVASVLSDHAVDAGLAPWHVSIEPMGFCIQLGFLGYIALARFSARGRQLAAVEQEMRSARDIQTSILPRGVLSVPGVEVAARYVPLAAVAGDFYDIVPLDGRALALLVADVSGHGVPAALIASMVKVSFTAALSETDDPGAILDRMNRTLCGMFERSFVTAACLVLRPAAGTLSYALAGHPAPLLQSCADGEIELLDERGVFLGVMPSATYRTATMPVRPGARLILYSDGVTETMNPSEDLFGTDRLRAFAAAERACPASAFADALFRALRTFARAAPAHDDVTFIIADLTD